jgi:endogenous inhibitor of DNA gyrase (YacG/DUF329 family)
MTKVKPCPVCRKARSEEFAPFCSSRCRDRDLGQWLSDGYAIPGPPVDPEDIVPRDDPRDD